MTKEEFRRRLFERSSQAPIEEVEVHDCVTLMRELGIGIVPLSRMSEWTCQAILEDFADTSERLRKLQAAEEARSRAKVGHA